MCGITGIWGDTDETLVKTMMDLLQHRGPDAEGIFRSEKSPGILGHRRLSIMDPQGGDQPIFNEDASAAVIANGEIYNFPELRKVIEGEHQFRTTSDSEVILHLFEDHDRRVVNHLDGMFAFALASGENLFLARDPIGIKPLYFGNKKDENGVASYYFSSELNHLPKLKLKLKNFHPAPAFTPALGS